MSQRPVDQSETNHHNESMTVHTLIHSSLSGRCCRTHSITAANPSSMYKKSTTALRQVQKKVLIPHKCHPLPSAQQPQLHTKTTAPLRRLPRPHHPQALPHTGTHQPSDKTATCVCLHRRVHNLVQYHTFSSTSHPHYCTGRILVSQGW